MNNTQSISIVDSIKSASHKKNRIAMIMGSIFGGFIPVASYLVSHYETGERPLMWLLVAGGLIFSALTVFEWGKVAFKNPFKAVGFVLILEGVLTFSSNKALSFAALALLIAINGIASGCKLALDSKENRQDRKTAKKK